MNSFIFHFKSLFGHRHETQQLDEHVCQLIESLWLESIGDLEEILAVRPASISLNAVKYLLNRNFRKKKDFPLKISRNRNNDFISRTKK